MKYLTVKYLSDGFGAAAAGTVGSSELINLQLSITI